MSNAASFARCLPWIVGATVLVASPGRFRELDAGATMATTVHRPSTPLVVPRPAVATLASRLAIAPANLPQQVVPENILMEEHPAELLLPDFPLTQTPRTWILSDSAWKSIGQCPLKFDCGMNLGQPYIGVRLVMPFGG